MRFQNYSSKFVQQNYFVSKFWEGEGWGLDNNLYLSEIKMSKIRWGRWGGGVSIIQTMSSNYLLSFSDITPKLLHHFSPIKIPSI